MDYRTKNPKIEASTGHNHISIRNKQAEKKYARYCKTVGACKPKLKELRKWEKKNRRWRRAVNLFGSQIRAVDYGFKPSGPEPKSSHRNRGA